MLSTSTESAPNFEPAPTSTSFSGTSIPAGTPTSYTYASITTNSFSYTPSTPISTFTVDATSSIISAIIMTFPSTTFTTTLAQATSLHQGTTISSSRASPSNIIDVNSAHDVCVGHGLDSLSTGAISTLIFSVAVASIIWLLFAVVRPRMRELYALREWFLRPDLRPPPLGNGLFSFLHPPVPMIPSLPSDVSNLGDSPAGDALLFPSDDELIQRTIWVAFLLVLGWTFVGLSASIPLYLVKMPCFGNTYSALQDLSVLRLLRLLDNGRVNTSSHTGSNLGRSPSSLTKRLVVDGVDEAHKARVRLVILAIVLLIAVVPALIKLLREFNALVAYRKRWVTLRCEGHEMGWLSVDRVPGLAGLGEKDVKDVIIKYGLSVSLEPPSGIDPRRRTDEIQRRYRESSAMDDENGAFAAPAPNQEHGADIDVTGVFSIVDTDVLSGLVKTRAFVLNNLEQAECLYIDSFKVSSSEALTSAEDDIVPLESPDTYEQAPREKRIGRPRPLRSSRLNYGRRSASSSSRPPTTYIAPSSYYRLRGIRRVSDATTDRNGSNGGMMSEFGYRATRSRIDEAPPRQSVTFGPLPQDGHPHAERPEPINFTQGPNYGEPDPEEEARWLDQEGWDVMPDRERLPEILERQSFLSRIGLGFPPRGSRLVTYRETISEESFASPHDSSEDRHAAIRNLDFGVEGEPLTQVPSLAPVPRLRLQEPIMRPVSGLHQEHLTSLYQDIRRWRSQLKALNIEIEDQQKSAVDQIAQGRNVRGWLLVGKGIRFFPGVRMIEGRSKDDIRWEELQHDGGLIGRISFWIIVSIVGVVLAGACQLRNNSGPCTRFSPCQCPDFAYYLPLLNTVDNYPDFWPGVLTTLVPAVAASLFMCIAVGLVHYAAKFSGSVSNSGTRLMALKATFYIMVVIAGVWLIGISSILFSINSFKNGSGETRSLSTGAIYIAAFCMCIGIYAAFIAPGLLLLQPLRLLRVLRARWKAITPRQTFRAVYPRPYNPSFGMAACILAVFFTATFSLLFPLIGPPLVVLVFLTLVAHRYLIGYVYGRVERGQTGGLLHIWLVGRFATMLSLQPLLLGLLLLVHRMWVLGGILLAAAGFIIVFVEAYTTIRLREPGTRSLTNTTRDSLDEFSHVITTAVLREDDEKTLPSLPRSRSVPDLTRSRTTSFASLLDMISSTLAVTPSRRVKGPVPLPTESIDDLISTARAAATNPDTPPQLNPDDPADNFADLLYPPETLAPPPAIWLTNDPAGIGRSEVSDLERFHRLNAVLDTAPARRPGGYH
ncbi:uncharacterized protein EI90DRAFT_3050622 [Cantharellus anzutake]|uniref:uncharacterized protein n=1 Tax=Cantharellus anzutake TaxID=1750568 RepID=UPI00190539B3|nr:uncharacterized protein EI90DRAFT_3050622 [Cantharellus anzutake]KAF8334005.1 hypothetical protein EI90DRAFT_3050622 [Cantharellus anzutake]